MSQEVNVPAANFEDLSSIPRTYIMENQFLQAIPLLHTCSVVHVCEHAPIKDTQIHLYNKRQILNWEIKKHPYCHHPITIKWQELRHKWFPQITKIQTGLKQPTLHQTFINHLSPHFSFSYFTCGTNEAFPTFNRCSSSFCLSGLNSRSEQTWSCGVGARNTRVWPVLH